MLDTDNSLVRAVTGFTCSAGVACTIATATINDFAGNRDEEEGYSGDGGPATTATLNNPMGIAVAPAGSGFVLYIADTFNHAIRAVTAGGNMVTLSGSIAGQAGFADGAATAALFWNPAGLAVEPTTGNLLIADENNNRVRYFGVASATTTGTGTASPSPSHTRGVSNSPTDTAQATATSTA